RPRRQVRQRRIALEKIVPGSSGLRNLTKVVHHIKRMESGFLRFCGDPPQLRTKPARASFSTVAAYLQSKTQAGRLFLLTPYGFAGAGKGGAHQPDRLGRQELVVPFLTEQLARLCPRPKLGRQGSRWDAVWPVAISIAAFGRRRIKGDGDAGKLALS